MTKYNDNKNPKISASVVQLRAESRSMCVRETSYPKEMEPRIQFNKGNLKVEALPIIRTKLLPCHCNFNHLKMNEIIHSNRYKEQCICGVPKRKKQSTRGCYKLDHTYEWYMH